MTNVRRGLATFTGRSSVGALLLLFLACAARAQVGELGPVTARSTTGQFAVRGIPQGPPRPRWSATSEVSYLRLDPALTAVSLERIRQTLNSELNLPEKWRGLITVTTFPAHEDDAAVGVTSVHYADGWGYNVEMPEIIDKPRFIRCAVSVLLLELANRNAVTREVELPPWLAEGFSAYLETTALPTLALEPGTNVSRAVRVDPLRSARELVRERGALTFNQLSQPSDAQLSGSGFELHRACSHLLVHELLRLDGGRDALREMLAILPLHYNWQTAFLRAFRSHFPRLIEADKWFALTATHLSGRDSFSVWPPATAFAQLDEILLTPVQVRADASDLPIATRVKLQRIVAEWDFAKQTPVLEQKLAQLHILRRRAPAGLVELVVAYELVLDGYTRPRPGRSRGERNESPVNLRLLGRRDTIKRLDALDERLEMLKAKLQPPPSPAPSTARAD